MFGEIIYGHYGQYRKCQYGEVPEKKDQFLEKVEIGPYASTNQVIVIEKEWIWSTLAIKEEESGKEYWHAVFEANKPESRYGIAKMVDFPFCSSGQCDQYLGSEELRDADKFKEARSRELEICPEQEHDVMDIPKETTAELICYIYDNMYKKNTDFLCIIVPDDVTDYQKYCRSVINKLMGVLPVGLRQEVRIATNPSEKERSYYGIYFKRDNGEVVKGHDIRLGDDCKGKGFGEPISDKMQRVLHEFARDVSLVERCYKEVDGKNDVDIEENIEKLAEKYSLFLDGINEKKVEYNESKKLQEIYSKRNKLLEKLANGPEKSIVQNLLDLSKNNQAVDLLTYIFNKSVDILSSVDATRENFEKIYDCYILLADRSLYPSLDRKSYERFDKGVKKYLSEYQKKYQNAEDMENVIRFAGIIVDVNKRNETFRNIFSRYKEPNKVPDKVDLPVKKEEMHGNDEGSKVVQNEEKRGEIKRVHSKSKKGNKGINVLVSFSAFLGALLGGVAAILLSMQLPLKKQPDIIPVSQEAEERELETEEMKNSVSGNTVSGNNW